MTSVKKWKFNNKTMRKYISDFGLRGIDLLIIKELQKNPHLSDSSIAKNCGIQESLVVKRMNSLSENKIIINHRKLNITKSSETFFFVSLNLDFNMTTVQGAIKSLNDINEVNESYFTSGDYQILCKVATENHQDFYGHVYNEIAKIEGVTKLSVISCFKKEFIKELIYF